MTTTKEKTDRKDTEIATEAHAGKHAIKIEDGIPIPPRKTGWGEARYPLAEMAQGQSFVVPVAKGDTLARLRNRLHGASVRSGVRIVVRPEGDGTIRVWHDGLRAPKADAAKPDAE